MDVAIFSLSLFLSHTFTLTLTLSLYSRTAYTKSIYNLSGSHDRHRGYRSIYESNELDGPRAVTILNARQSILEPFMNDRSNEPAQVAFPFDCFKSSDSSDPIPAVAIVSTQYTIFR